MRAIVQTIYGGPEVLHLAEVPIPELRPRDLLVRVHAAGVNPVDAKQRGGGPAGAPVPEAPKIVGWDAAGVVAGAGAEATRFAIGDEVFFAGDITRAGAYAEYVAVDERIVGRKPHTLSFAEAAAVPLVALTAWEGLLEAIQADRGDAGRGTRLCMIVGGAGGVGSTAIQVARRVCNLQVIATASRPASADYCRRMGADHVVDHTRPLAEQLAALGFAGADYIFSTARLGNFPHLVAALNPLGKICCILGGEEATRLDVSGLFPIRGTLAFELMFTRPRTGIELERQGAILDRVSTLVDDGAFISTLTQTLPWQEAPQAHHAIESGHTIGKIVLSVE
jgi:zinc-binding alcohol dehydrogenase family protein